MYVVVSGIDIVRAGTIRFVYNEKETPIQVIERNWLDRTGDVVGDIASKVF